MYFHQLDGFLASGRSSSLDTETSDATGNIKAKTYYTFLEIHACSQNIHSKIRKIFKFFEDKINRGYYTAVRRYEFYLRVVKTIFYERAQRVSKILFSPREDKIHIFKPPCNVLFII